MYLSKLVTLDIIPNKKWSLDTSTVEHIDGFFPCSKVVHKFLLHNESNSQDIIELALVKLREADLMRAQESSPCHPSQSIYWRTSSSHPTRQTPSSTIRDNIAKASNITSAMTTFLKTKLYLTHFKIA